MFSRENSMQNSKGIAILGASGGLGHAIVSRLAGQAPLTLGYCNNRDKAEALAGEVTDAGGRAAAAQVDIRDGASVGEFLTAAAGQGDGLAGIVSVTGPPIPLAPLAEVGEDEFRRIYDTDVLGSFNVLKHGARILAEAGGGAMLLFLTTAVLKTLDNDGMSGAPKMAVEGLLRQTAREMGKANVRVNGVAPGVIDAGIVHSSFEVDEVAKSVIEDCLGQTPMGRMGKPEEVASLVEYLLSPDAAYISGQVIAVDGGYSA